MSKRGRGKQTNKQTNPANLTHSGEDIRTDDTSTSKKGRGKRGKYYYQQNYKVEDYHVEFDKLNRPVGKRKSMFMSLFGLKVREELDYHLDTKYFEKVRWEKVWFDTKVRFNIKTDEQKDFMLKKAKKLATKFISRLTNEYVHTNKLPFAEFTYVDPKYWDGFVKKKKSKEALAKSEKARESAKANTNICRLGRDGYTVLETKGETIWPQLEAENQHLKTVQNERAKAIIMGQAIKNSVTNVYELAPASYKTVEGLVSKDREMTEDGGYLAGKDDPVTRVMGPEHGGQTRGVSDVIGTRNVYGGKFNNGKKRARSTDSLDVNNERASVPLVDNKSSLACRGASASKGPVMAYPPIEKLTSCELLDPFNLKDELMVAVGRIWPTSDGILNGKMMDKGFVKVEVDKVIEGCNLMAIPESTKTNDIKHVGDMLRKFVPWPRYALKIVNKGTSNKSTGPLENASSPVSSIYTVASPHTTSDIASASCFYPEIEQDDPYELQMPNPQYLENTSFMNLLMKGEDVSYLGQTQHMPCTKVHDPNQEFSDPDVENSLNRIKSKPRAIQAIVEILSKCVGRNHRILIFSPANMYSQIIQDVIPYSELLQVFLRGCLDMSLIHWFAMNFYESPNSQCAFFNPHLIKGYSCTKNPLGVEEHILDLFELHHYKTYFVAPYLANEHWTLIIICPSTKKGYIIDSISSGKDQCDYLLTNIIQSAFRFPFKWDMVKCKQQMSSWECGYMVIKHMYEFVNFIQHDFHRKLWNETGYFLPEEIDNMILNLMPKFTNKVFPTTQRLA